MIKNRTVAQMLGEAAPPADVADPAAADPAAAAPAAPPVEPVQMDYSNPTVEQLVQLWQSGQHEAVALRVLDALDHYADFMELAHQIGHNDAIELGQIMDTMTSEEHSPHQYDTVPDTEVNAQMMTGRSVGDAHGSPGEI